MSEEERLKLENELLLTKSKAQMINHYLDLLQENQQLKDRLNKAVEILHNINENLPLDLILTEIEHTEYVLKGDKE